MAEYGPFVAILAFLLIGGVIGKSLISRTKSKDMEAGEAAPQWTKSSVMTEESLAAKYPVAGAAVESVPKVDFDAFFDNAERRDAVMQPEETDVRSERPKVSPRRVSSNAL